MVKQRQFYPSLLLISLLGPGHAPLLYAQDANNVKLGYQKWLGANKYMREQL